MMPMKADPTPESLEIATAEVPPKATRRKFTVAYKRKILEKASSLKESPGEIGALLRREGLYTSHLSAWRRELKAGRLEGRGARQGRPVTHDSRRLLRENRRLQQRLRVLETVVEVQRKLCGLFGLPTADEEPQK
jgi:transposase-like protein